LPVTGPHDPNLASFDNLMTRFVHDNNVPGGALAVTHHGKLVYARGFGYADRDKKEPVEPASLFRIASITKPFTATAVLQLVQRGKVKLGDKVFEHLKYDPVFEGNAKPDPRLHEITVQQLLQHTGGWDRDKSFDPMFRPIEIARVTKTPAPAGQVAIIRYMLGKPLDFNPGARCAYSNFGYCVLGRLIEHVTGGSYEEFVRQDVLKPLGIHGMRQGKTLIGGRTRGEVMYYDEKNRTGKAVFPPFEKVSTPYGTWSLEAMDSHGGWIASAVDLVRFASAFGPDRFPLIDASMAATMFKRPTGAAGGRKGKPADSYYACGWDVRPVNNRGQMNTWHNGSLDGTSTILVRRFDGLNWALLFNTRENQAGAELSDKIDESVHEAADAVKRWPNIDTFSKYLKEG
jgi:N-acyl-D-amino-acid deacylase